MFVAVILQEEFAYIFLSQTLFAWESHGIVSGIQCCCVKIGRQPEFFLLIKLTWSFHLSAQRILYPWSPATLLGYVSLVILGLSLFYHTNLLILILCESTVLFILSDSCAPFCFYFLNSSFFFSWTMPFLSCASSYLISSCYATIFSLNYSVTALYIVFHPSDHFNLKDFFSSKFMARHLFITFTAMVIFYRRMYFINKFFAFFPFVLEYTYNFYDSSLNGFHFPKLCIYKGFLEAGPGQLSCLARLPNAKVLLATVSTKIERFAKKCALSFQIFIWPCFFIFMKLIVVPLG